MTGKPNSAVERVANSHVTRVVVLAFLVVLFLIPLELVRGVIGEREQRRNHALDEVRSTWGGAQTVVGPKLVVPYIKRRTTTNEDGEQKIHISKHAAYFLPDALVVDSLIAGENRQRGIFDVPVFTMSAEVSGSFSRPDFSDWDVEAADIAWDRAHIVVNIADTRAIQELSTLTWGDQKIAFEPGAGECDTSGGLHAIVGSTANNDRVEFSFPLKINGSVAAQFAPFGKDTRIKVESDWPHPSFTGAWLPVDHAVDASGFAATWEIPYLGRNYPQRWTSSSVPDVTPTFFGVNLLTPVDHYRMAYRSVKYGALFLFLTFGTLWLFEVIAGARVHALHYLLVGAAMCLFYLLELSLSEHIGFVWAYTIATAAVLSLTVPYSRAILGRTSRASTVGVVLLVLYGYLYVLLRNQDYALLAGSIGLFFALAIVMYLTRNVDWGGKKPLPADRAGGV